MALRLLTPTQLAGTPTLLASFMGERHPRRRTVGELLAIYSQASKTLRAAEDSADDMRVERFARDMAARRWREQVVVQVGIFHDIVHVIDGIHRSIAYLRCIEEGFSPAQLPALHVDC